MIAGAVALAADIAAFLFAGSPQGGTSHPDAAAWWAAILATVAAAGVGFALQAAVTKEFMTSSGTAWRRCWGTGRCTC